MKLAGKRVVVMGLGNFGGGVGAARYLVDKGCDVLVTDLNPADKLEASLKQLEKLPIEYRLGEHRVSDFTTCDLVVVNPAVNPHNNRYLRGAAAAGVRCLTEMQLLLRVLSPRTRILGVTGTAGKSTTTAMIGHIMARHRGKHRVHVGGNIGGSLLPIARDIPETDFVILELSSFMLEWIRNDKWSPRYAVVTNISKNHLDRHGSFDAYVQAKETILAFQKPRHHAVLGPGVGELMDARCDDVVEVDIAHPIMHDLPLPGAHNRLNATLAMHACAFFGVDHHKSAHLLQSFHGLPHRMEYVGRFHDVRYFNDSKSTTPEAAILALRCFDRGKVHIILGGDDKGSDLTGLGRAAAEHARCVYTIGKTGDAIAQAVREHAPPADEHETPRGELIVSGDLEHATREAVHNARPDDVVLLSPGCASWDQFKNYEQRGQQFKDLVREVAG